MDFQFFDSDHHNYEVEDAFTRYAGDGMVKEKYLRWLTEADGKRRRPYFGGREADVIGNPTFNLVVQPGSFREVLKTSRWTVGTVRAFRQD